MEEQKEDLAKKWIQGADIKEGGLTAWCKENGFDGVCQACINKAAKAGGHPAKMANFACNMPNSPYTYPKETHSAEEIKMEDIKTEQLTEVKTEQLKVEEPKTEIKVEKLSEEKPAEVKPAEEKPVEVKTEVVAEAKVEAPVEVKTEIEKAIEQPVNEQLAKESLSKDIEKTKEELAVVKEVRDELVTLYARYKDLEAGKESLSKEKEQLSNDNKVLSEKLGRYEKAEAELKAKERAARIEKLSVKFKVLGQEKSVEQLSQKDEETLSEFEKIVDAALDKAGETKEALAATQPSQAAEEKQPVEKLKSEEVKPKPEQLKRPNFFEGICKTLTTEQLSNETRKKTLFM